MGEPSNDRYKLATAGHHFLFQALPLRAPDSQIALTSFIHKLRTSSFAAADMEPVLLRCLVVLNDHTGGRMPSLVDRYLTACSRGFADIAQFVKCVEAAFAYHGIGDPKVQRALEMAAMHLGNPSIGARTIAEKLGVQASTLRLAVKRHTHISLGEHIRLRRMERAAAMLLESNASIKEIWASVGYNHASNFVHDFRQYFHTPPSEFRKRGVLTAPRGTTEEAKTPASAPQPTRPRSRTLLLVDDDVTTIEVLSRALPNHGYEVYTAGNCDEGYSVGSIPTPDVALIEYRLVGTDGLAFLHRLRRASPMRKIGAAIFTADWQAFDRRDEAAALGAMIVSKLCDVDEVHRLLRRLTTQHLTGHPAFG